MFVTIWKFTTSDPQAFEKHYGGAGSWAQLFSRAPEYRRTDLLADGSTYVTLDWWTSRAAYESFRDRHAEAYAMLDRECERLTTSEVKLGEFETVD